MNNKLLKSAALAVALTTAGALSAQASLYDVKQIVITSYLASVSPDGGWALQVSEVLALDESGNDMALAGTATATGSAYRNGAAGNSPSKAIDGVAAVAYPNIFHSATGAPSESLTITFDTAFTMSELSIFGRSGCCSDRDIYNVEIFNALGESIFTATEQSAYNAANEAVVALPTAAVPLPAALPLMVAGLGALGIAARRKA